MTKLGARRDRERQSADAMRVLAPAHLKSIKAACPGDVPDAARERFAARAAEFVSDYLARLPLGVELRRKHRAAETDGDTAAANRPADTLRHGLIGDLCDAYTDFCGDFGARGMRRVINAVLVAAGLPRLSKRDLDAVNRHASKFQAWLDRDNSTD